MYKFYEWKEICFVRWIEWKLRFYSIGKGKHQNENVNENENEKAKQWNTSGTMNFIFLNKNNDSIYL